MTLFRPDFVKNKITFSQYGVQNIKLKPNVANAILSPEIKLIKSIEDKYIEWKIILFSNFLIEIRNANPNKPNFDI